MLSITFSSVQPTSKEDSVSAQLSHDLEAIGFYRLSAEQYSWYFGKGSTGAALAQQATGANVSGVSVKSADKSEPEAEQHDEPAALAPAAAPEQAEAPKPRRGRPPKEAKAEEVAASIAQEAKVVPQPEPAPQISASPEDRKPPEETAAALTHDDVRQAIGAYGQKFGDEVAVKNGRTFMGLLPGQKIPEIPADRIAAVVAALRGAIASGKPEPASAVDDLG